METSAPGVVENKNEFHQQIWATSKLLKFGSLVFVEKDFYVTQIIHILSQIKNPHYQLYFQGGTALAKAYKITERMSEDCDFRIALRPGLSFNRSTLREFRQTIIKALCENGFNCSDDTVRVRNLGQFMELKIPYSWEKFMVQMVFGEKPLYADVVDNFISKSEKILHSLEIIPSEAEII